MRRYCIRSSAKANLNCSSGSFGVATVLRSGTVRCGTVPYRYGTIPVPYRSQISFALTGLAARANHHFYLLRAVLRVQNGIVTLYGCCVRLISPSDLACVRARARTIRGVTGNLPQLNDPTMIIVGTKVMVMLLLQYSQQ